MSSLIDSIVNSHETIRSLSQAAGAIMAAIFAPVGLWFTWKRTQALSNQNDLTAKAQNYIATNDKQKRLYESYQLGIQEIAHEHEFRRLGGIVILGDAAKELQFTKASFTAISGLIRIVSGEIKTECEPFVADEVKLKINKRLDLIAAIEQIKYRKVDVPSYSLYEYAINLQNSFIPYSNLSSANMKHALLDNINMKESYCVLADFCKASIRNADLSGSNFRKSDFSLAILAGSDLSMSNLTKTRLIGADISGVDFRGCEFTVLTILNFSDEASDNLDKINMVLPKKIKFGDFYHPIQTARWDIENPPIVDDEIRSLIDEKTEFMRDKNLL